MDTLAAIVSFVCVFSVLLMGLLFLVSLGWGIVGLIGIWHESRKPYIATRDTGGNFMFFVLPGLLGMMFAGAWILASLWSGLLSRPEEAKAEEAPMTYHTGRR